MEERLKNVMDVVFLLNITTIGKNACDSCYSLVTVVIPENIESIIYGAFWYCTSLLNVSFPKSLKSIRDVATVTKSKPWTSLGQPLITFCTNLPVLKD